MFNLTSLRLEPSRAFLENVSCSICLASSWWQRRWLHRFFQAGKLVNGHDFLMIFGYKTICNPWISYDFLMNLLFLLISSCDLSVFATYCWKHTYKTSNKRGQLWDFNIEDSRYATNKTESSDKIPSCCTSEIDPQWMQQALPTEASIKMDD